MEPASDFRWPDDPPQDWWEATGAALGMKAELVRFAAALAQLGGPDARKNSVAARLAGVEGGRTQAFRAARSVGVSKLLDEAEKIKTGKQPPLSESDIDRKIEDLIRSPDAGTVAKGIELRHRREEHRRQRGEHPSDDGFLYWRFERDMLTMPNGAGAYLLLIDSIAGLYLLHDTHWTLMREERGPELWASYYARLSDLSRASLDRQLADPGYQLEARRKIWAEIGMKPPAPIDVSAVDPIKREPAHNPTDNAEVAADAA